MITVTWQIDVEPEEIVVAGEPSPESVALAAAALVCREHFKMESGWLFDVTMELNGERYTRIVDLENELVTEPPSEEELEYALEAVKPIAYSPVQPK